MYICCFNIKKGKKKQSKLIFQKFSNQKQPVFQKREKRVQKTGTQKTIKELLGELYADKVYLEKLLDDDRKIYSNRERPHTSVYPSKSIILTAFLYL